MLTQLFLEFLNAQITISRLSSITSPLFRISKGTVWYPELNKNLKVHGTPWKFSKTPANIKRAPKLGEHNSEILKKLGYTDDEIENLTNEKII